MGKNKLKIQKAPKHTAADVYAIKAKMKNVFTLTVVALLIIAMTLPLFSGVVAMFF